MGLGLRDEGVSRLMFAMQGGQILVELRGERDQLFEPQTNHDLELHFEATIELEPPSEVRVAFENLAVGRLPPGSLSPNNWPKPLAQLDPSGEIRGPLEGVPMAYMPQAFQRLAVQIQRELQTAASRAVGLLRWRAGVLGPVQPLSPPRPPFTRSRHSWSLGGDEWHPFPGRTAGIIDVGHVSLELREDAERNLQQLVEDGKSEPFAYELLREAWGLCHSNPRSSLLIAMAALEVGVKQYIADRVEPAEWLVNNMPSPDVIKLLRDYLPKLEPTADHLDPASTLAPLPESLMGSRRKPGLLMKRRDQRNAIAHRPEAHQRDAQVATPERAQSAVLAVQQVLFRLDIANGHAWAHQHLREPPDDPPPSGYRRVGG